MARLWVCYWERNKQHWELLIRMSQKLSAHFVFVLLFCLLFGLHTCMPVWMCMCTHAHGGQNYLPWHLLPSYFKILFIIKFSDLFCVWVFCLHVDQVGAWCLVRAIPWDWSYRWLGITMWVLGILAASSARKSSTLNHWIFFPAPKILLGVCVCLCVCKVCMLRGMWEQGHDTHVEIWRLPLREFQGLNSGLAFFGWVFIHSFIHIGFWGSASLHSSGWPATPCVAAASPSSQICLPLSPESRDQRCGLPHQVTASVFSYWTISRVYIVPWDWVTYWLGACRIRLGQLTSKDLGNFLSLSSQHWDYKYTLPRLYVFN